jgi:flagellar basal body-associated protein FliL
MKKALLIVGGLAVALVAALVGIVWYLLSSSEAEKNRKRTEAARANRWRDRTEPQPPTDTVDTVAEVINENLNGNEEKA